MSLNSILFQTFQNCAKLILPRQVIIHRRLRLVEMYSKEPMQRSKHIIHKTTTQTPPNRNGVLPWLSRPLDDLCKQKHFVHFHVIYVYRQIEQSVCIISSTSVCMNIQCKSTVHRSHEHRQSPRITEDCTPLARTHVYNQTHKCSVYCTSHHAAITNSELLSAYLCR